MTHIDTHTERETHTDTHRLTQTQTHTDTDTYRQTQTHKSNKNDKTERNVMQRVRTINWKHLHPEYQRKKNVRNFAIIVLKITKQEKQR